MLDFSCVKLELDPYAPDEGWNSVNANDEVVYSYNRDTYMIAFHREIKDKKIVKIKCGEKVFNRLKTLFPMCVSEEVEKTENDCA